MIAAIFKGMQYYIKAIPKFLQFNLLQYVLLIVVLLVFYFSPFFVFSFFISIFNKILPLPSTVYFLDLFTQITASISGFILLMFLSPLFSIVSEKVTKRLQGKTYQFSFKQSLKDIFRGLKITLRNLIYQYILVAVLYILIYSLPENTIYSKLFSVLLAIISSYFYGFTLLDYALENQRFDYYKSVNFIRKHKGISIGLGLVYYLVLKFNNLPFVYTIFGINTYYITTFLEAFLLLFGVVGATLFVVEEQNKKDTKRIIEVF